MYPLTDKIIGLAYANICRSVPDGELFFYGNEKSDELKNYFTADFVYKADDIVYQVNLDKIGEVNYNFSVSKNGEWMSSFREDYAQEDYNYYFSRSYDSFMKVKGIIELTIFDKVYREDDANIFIVPNFNDINIESTEESSQDSLKIRLSFISDEEKECFIICGKDNPYLYLFNISMGSPVWNGTCCTIQYTITDFKNDQNHKPINVNLYGE